MRFNPCMLFLSRSAACVAAGLRGERLSLREALPLRSDVSTDEITPIAILTHYDHELARFPYTGFTTEDRQPVGPGAVVAAGIEVVVAGKRYGKGSSREHSPAAERAAGVRLVIAESFERIYRQNADNIGLLTSTDLGLVDRIAAGEAIALTELLQDRDELTQAILRAGGLLRFGQAHMQDLPLAASQEDRGPQTLFDKIVERHALASPAAPYPPTSPRSGVFVRPDWRFIHEYYTGMAAHMLFVNESMSREHFFNAAALTMRRILMDRARQKATVKHGGAEASARPLPLDAPDMSADDRLLLIEESLQRFEKENPDDTRIVMLKFFAGLNNLEVAEMLGVNEKTVRRKWTLAKARLFQILTEIESGQDAPPPSA